jgi:thiol-disulfide isomerase/thioredoxin
MKNVILFVTGVLVLVMLAACSPAPAAESEAETAVMPETSDDMMVEEMAEPTAETMTDDKDDMMTEGDHAGDMAEEEPMSEEPLAADAMMDLPAWQTIALTNAATGETFTLADYAGKTVFVEPMATWCTNCRNQLINVREARSQFGDDVVFIGLSLETNISDEQLAAYQTNEGFDWTFAVMSPELLQSLADTFGRSITSAPSTPHFIIRPDGSYTDLVTGIDAPDVLVQQIQAAQ